MKKLISTFLTAILMIALCVPTAVFADDEHVHTPGEPEFVYEDAPGCVDEGARYYEVYCTECQELINSYSVKIDPTGHLHTEEYETERENASCTTDGYIQYTTYCTDCWTPISERTETLKAQGHPELIDVVTESHSSSCTEYGYDIHTFYCTTCWDEVKTERVDYTTLGDHVHSFSIENEVEATCTTPGSYDLVDRCTVCKQELSRETVTIDPYHEWGFSPASWTWADDGSSATATYVCNKDSSHTLDAIATIEEIEREDPTCSEDGYVKYTATVNHPVYLGMSASDEKTVILKATGEHSEDLLEMPMEHVNPTCVSDGYDLYDLICTDCWETVRSEKRNIVPAGPEYHEYVFDHMDTVQPTCTTDGHATTYSKCKYCNDVKEETFVLPAEHTFLIKDIVWNWADDYSSATATFVCSECEYEETVDADIEVVETQPANCQNEGYIKYRATANPTNYKLIVNDTKTQVLTKTAHTPAEAVEENRVEPTTEKDGSVDMVVYCSECQTELSRTNKVLPKKTASEETGDDQGSGSQTGGNQGTNTGSQTGSDQGSNTGSQTGSDQGTNTDTSATEGQAAGSTGTGSETDDKQNATSDDTTTTDENTTSDAKPSDNATEESATDKTVEGQNDASETSGSTETSSDTKTVDEATNAVSYQIIKGANTEWTKGGNDVTITSDAVIEKYSKTLVDNNVVDAQYLDVTSGSTNVKFASAYLEKLSVGEHSVEIVSIDGSAKTKLIVKEATADTKTAGTTDANGTSSAKTDGKTTPATGDTANACIWLIAMISAIFAVTALARKRN